MSSSQFDDLLGDFGDSSTTTTTTKSTANGDNSELLLDFGGSSQVTNGQASSNGVNPLYDLESLDASPEQTQQPLSSNPLYDFDFNDTTTLTTTTTLTDTTEDTPAPSSNPLYEFENTATTTTPPAEQEPASSNPFQDFENLGGGGGDSGEGDGQEIAQDSSVDLLSGSSDQPQPDTPSNQVDSADLLGDFNSGPQAVDESNTMQEGDSGIQSEHNGSSSLVDDFTAAGITVTTTQDQEQPEAGDESDQLRENAGDVEEENEAKDVDDADVVDEAEVEPLPDLVVKEEGDDEGIDDQHAENVETPLEEEAPSEAPLEVEAPTESEAAQVEAPSEAQQDEPQIDDVQEEDAHCSEASQEEVRGDDYSADRREEDLEQYCIDREEETSEVSEGVVAPEEGGESAPSGGCEEEKDEQQQYPVEDAAGEIHGEEQISKDMTDEQFSTPAEVEQPREEAEEEKEKEEEEEKEEEANHEPEVHTVDEPVVDAPLDRKEDNDEEQEEAVAAAQQPNEEGESDAVEVTPSAGDKDDDVVDGSPAGMPEEVEDIVEVTPTPTAEDEPLDEPQELVEPINEPQEPAPSQWPPVEDSEHPQQVQESLKLDIQEEPAPSNQTVDNNQPEMMTTNGVTENRAQQEWEDEDEEEEEGVYENEPVRRDDVARESDKKDDVNLPSPGLAQNLLAKFNTGTAANSTPRSKREITPPNPTMGGGEYVSEPRAVMEKYEGKAESGVFESEPEHNPEVVRSDSHLEDALPQQGSAKKFAARYAQIDQEGKTKVVTSNKEITTDRDSGPVEYVSEPRGFTERYEGKSESGVFESQPAEAPGVVKSSESKGADPVPERGTAKNLAQRFHQISVESASPVASSRNKRELTPDKSGQCEYVSEPRAQVETYQGKVESGVFENTPLEDPEVVKSQTTTEEYVPERGYAKNVAAKFKELESTAKSPPLSPGRRKEFTPPREDQATSRTSGVYESTPESKPDVITSADSQQEVMPGAGTARSLAQRYKEIEAQSKSPVASKPKKELTPPPNDAGVYENKPDRFQADYNRPAESGILENTPVAQRDDVLRSSEGGAEVDLPEAGSAKNLVNKWRQIESESAKNTSPGSAGGRHKEFTPPRDEPRISQNSKSPRTPKSPAADSSNHQLDNGSVHPSDLPGQYQPQNEPSVFESNPETNPDALREADTDKSQGLPKKNQAKKMLARFQSIQAEANKELPKPVPKKQQDSKTKTFRKESDSPRSSHESSFSSAENDAAMEATRLKFEDPDQVGRSKSMRAAIQVEKCGACDKTVYAMERLEMNKRVYHRACFRCSQCKAVLTPKTFAINNEVIFCTTHYKQNFTTKGNYDEGFGRQQHKKHWNSNPNLANDSAADGDKS